MFHTHEDITFLFQFWELGLKKQLMKEMKVQIKDQKYQTGHVL